MFITDVILITVIEYDRLGRRSSDIRGFTGGKDAAIGSMNLV